MIGNRGSRLDGNANAPRFAIATRDELWAVGETAVLLESRLAHGEARTRGAELIASDAFDAELVAACDARLAAAQAAMSVVRDARVRIVVSARRIGDGTVREEEALIVTRRGVSIVSDGEHVAEDLELLDAATQPHGPSVDFEPRLPIIWLNGSGAVLLHEAVGHAAEHGHDAVEWPDWLRVRDVPELAVDDLGAAARPVDLLREAPACFRRESFRDVPLPRMTRLVVEQAGAPFDFPEPRIEVHLVAGGLYEPLTQTVTLFVTHAERVEANRAHHVRPFALNIARTAVARGLTGAYGQPIRYPGVVCSREGQEVVAGCAAPLLLTVFP